jgi:hypothetical protein
MTVWRIPGQFRNTVERGGGGLPILSGLALERTADY